MSNNTEIVYETMTVKSIRGLEARAIEKAEQDGWEFVSQTTGTLRTEILLRKPVPPKKPLSRLQKILIAAGVVVFFGGLTTVIIIGSISERNAAETAPTPTVTEVSAKPSQKPEPEPTSEPEPTTAPPAVITAENNADFAQILTLGDYCAPEIQQFAQDYRGATVSFDGSVGALNNHAGYATRYDLLIGAGDFSETSAFGPAFQFRDVNLVSDLNWIGENPGSIGVGTNLRVTAKVVEYEQSSCLFLIDPAATKAR